MADLFSKLLPYQWRGIEFDCSSFEVDLSQDHAEHKFPDRDGAHIEGTGRNPLVFTAKALFRNGIRSASKEPAYPTRFRKFLDACADRSRGLIQHPELGAVPVRCKSAKAHWEANRRDGADVDVVWVEDTNPGIGTLSSPSPIQSAIVTAAELDRLLGEGKLIVKPTPGLLKKSFLELIVAVTSVVDQANLFNKQIAGKINEVFFRLDVLSLAVNRAADVKNWPVRRSIEKMRSSLHDLAVQTLSLPFPKPVVHYIVPADTTLSGVAAATGSTITDILQLNGPIGPVVHAHTRIRYFFNVDSTV